MKPLFLALVLAVVLPRAAAAQEVLRFAIYRDGSPIGTHTVTITRDGEDTIADIAIDIRVRVALIPVFRYAHRSREVWRDGRLRAIDASTDDDGRQSRMTARATPAGLEVEGTAGRFVAPADILPTSWWRSETPRATRLLDTQRGRMISVSAARLPAGAIAVGLPGREVALWRLDGDLQLTVGYAPDGRWSAMEFSVRGSTIQYGPPATLTLR